RDTGTHCTTVQHYYGGTVYIKNIPLLSGDGTGFIVSPASGYNTIPVGSPALDVVAVGEQNYLEIVTDAAAEGIERTLETVEAGTYELTMNVQSLSGEFVATVTEEKNGNTFTLATEYITGTGSLVISFVP